jgi:chromatin remodeling complex protein RSC6
MNFNQKENNAGKFGLFLMGVNDRLKEQMYQLGRSAVDKVIEESTDNGGWQPPGADRWQKKIGQKLQEQGTEKAQSDKSRPERSEQNASRKVSRVLLRLATAVMAWSEMEAGRREAEKKASSKKGDVKQNSDKNQGKSTDKTKP